MQTEPSWLGDLRRLFEETALLLEDIGQQPDLVQSIPDWLINEADYNGPHLTSVFSKVVDDIRYLRSGAWRSEA